MMHETIELNPEEQALISWALLEYKKQLEQEIKEMEQSPDFADSSALKFLQTRLVELENLLEEKF